MEQKKTLIIVTHFPDCYPSLSLGTVETADEFDELLKYWRLEREDIAKSWADFSSADADALQELLKDRSEGFYENEGDELVPGTPSWEEYSGCEFLVRLLSAA